MLETKLKNSPKFSVEAALKRNDGLRRFYTGIQ